MDESVTIIVTATPPVRIDSFFADDTTIGEGRVHGLTLADFQC